MTIGITLAAGLCVFFVGASSAGGVRTLGGKTYDGAASINSAGKILVSPSNAAPAQVDLDDVLDAALGPAKSPPPVLSKGIVFTDGSALAVDRFDGIDDTTVKCTRGGKPATAELSQVARLIFQTVSEAQWAKVPAGHAGALLASGDFFEGDFNGLGGGLIRVNSVLFGPSEFVPGQQAAAVVLAEVKPGQSQWVVGLSDGSVFLAKSIRAEGEKLEIDAPPGAPSSVATKDVATIKVGADRIVAVDEKIVEQAAPAFSDRPVGGVPLALTGKAVARGFSMAAGGQATFAIPLGCRTFICRAGVPAGFVPSAKVRLLVLLDGREAFRSEARTSIDDPLEVAVPTGSARALTLKVESDDGADIGASGLWAEPSLVKGISP